MLEFGSFCNVQIADNLGVRLPDVGIRLHRFRSGRLVLPRDEDRTAYKNLKSYIELKRLPVKHVKEALLTLPQNAGAFAHFTKKSLPVLYLLNKMEVDLPIIVKERFMNRTYVSELVSLFENLEFIVVPKGTSMVVDNLKTVTNLKTFYDPDTGVGSQLLAEIRDFVKGKLLENGGEREGGQRDRIYISRRYAKRKIENEQQIEPVLNSYGFRTVILDNVSVAEQVRMFSRCDTLFGPHGAGLANELYMPTGSLVIEASYPSPSPQDLYFFSFSSLLGHNHLFVPGTRSDRNAPLKRHEDFLLHPEVLEALLQRTLSG